jgi:hypothetical protein
MPKILRKGSLTTYFLGNTKNYIQQYKINLSDLFGFEYNITLTLR